MQAFAATWAQKLCKTRHVYDTDVQNTMYFGKFLVELLKTHCVLMSHFRKHRKIGENPKMAQKRCRKIGHFLKIMLKIQCKMALHGQNTVQNEGQNQKVPYFTVFLTEKGAGFLLPRSATGTGFIICNISM